MLLGDGIDKYCLTAPIKRLRLNKTSSDSDYIHHEYRGSYLKFHSDGVEIYAKQLRSFLDFDLTTVQTVFNVMTHYVLNPDEETLQIYEGSQFRNNVIADRKTDAEPKLSVWDTLPRRKLITFKNTGKQINVKVGS